MGDGETPSPIVPNALFRTPRDNHPTLNRRLIPPVQSDDRNLTENARFVDFFDDGLESDRSDRSRKLRGGDGSGAEAIAANDDPVAGPRVVNLANQPVPGLQLKPLESSVPKLVGVA